MFRIAWSSLVVGIFLGALTCVSSEPDFDAAGLTGEVCRAIQFASQNGSEASVEDLNHCHVVESSTLSESGRKNWDKVAKYYVGLLCHAHEFESEEKRTFPDRDNVDILLRLNSEPAFMNLRQYAIFKDVAQVPGFENAQAMQPEIKFYPESEKWWCGRLDPSSVRTVSCTASKELLCMGFWKP